MFKSRPWSKGRKHHPEGERTRYFPNKRGNGNDIKILGKGGTSQETKKMKQKIKRTQTVVRYLSVAAGAHVYRGTIGRRASALKKAKRTKAKLKQNKRYARERKHDIHPEDTSSRHLWLVNYDE